MDMSPYRDLFVSEARSHLSAFSALIVHIEESPGDSAAIHELFRHAHSLKGMAATMGYEQLVAVAHTMEGQLGRIRNGEFPLVPALADLLLEEADALARQISLIETGNSTVEAITPLIKRLAVFAHTAELLQQSHDETPYAGEERPRKAAAPAAH